MLSRSRFQMAMEPSFSRVPSLVSYAYVESHFSRFVVDEEQSNEEKVTIVATAECVSPGGSCLMVRRFEQELIPAEPMLRGPVGMRNTLKRHAWELEVAEAGWMRHHQAEHRHEKWVKKMAKNPDQAPEPAPADSSLTDAEAYKLASASVSAAKPQFSTAIAVASLTRDWKARASQH